MVFTSKIRMANPEHLAILKQGVEVWNRWRSEKPQLKPDLTGAELSRMNLDFVDFTTTNLNEASLYEARAPVTIRHHGFPN
jgi:uncharacterized protein YjbI with pentapeptide repeats